MKKDRERDEARQRDQLNGPETIEPERRLALIWVDWFNNRRLLKPIGYLPPVEFEAAYYQWPAWDFWTSDS